MLESFRPNFARRQRQLHAIEILTALGLYQADHQKAPAQLDDLVPAYLANMPIDPVSGNAFGYRISGGELIDLVNTGGPRLQLAPGQAVLFAGEGTSAFYLPAPSWVK